MLYLSWVQVSQTFSPSICAILVWSGLISLFFSMTKTVQQGLLHLKKLHQVPCDRCAFHTGSYLLKCTVHPSKAFSEDAIGCVDYEPTGDRVAPCQRSCRAKK
jgi:hypothetical protein